MSLKRNTIANYLGHSYAVLLGIVIMPLYLTYLGPVPFGLVGFFILVQTSLHLLDMGLSPTLGRQIAYARGKNQGFKDFIKLLRSFEVIFFFLALLTSCSFFLAKNWISNEWIDAHSLNSDTTAYCITLMGLMVGLRWFSSL